MVFPKEFFEKSILKISADIKKPCEKLVAGQLGRRSSWPLSQLGPGSTQPESILPGVFTYILNHVYGFEFCITFQNKSKINIKQLLTNIAIKLLIDRIEGELAT